MTASVHSIAAVLLEPCTECREIFLRETLVDCSALAPFAGLCCTDCRDELVERGHIDTCDCSDCAGWRRLADLVARMAAVEPSSEARA